MKKKTIVIIVFLILLGGAGIFIFSKKNDTGQFSFLAMFSKCSVI